MRFRLPVKMIASLPTNPFFTLFFFFLPPGWHLLAQFQFIHSHPPTLKIIDLLKPNTTIVIWSGAIGDDFLFFQWDKYANGLSSGHITEVLFLLFENFSCFQLSAASFCKIFTWNLARQSSFYSCQIWNFPSSNCLLWIYLISLILNTNFIDQGIQMMKKKTSIFCYLPLFPFPQLPGRGNIRDKIHFIFPHGERGILSGDSGGWERSSRRTANDTPPQISHFWDVFLAGETFLNFERNCVHFICTGMYYNPFGRWNTIR